MRKSPHHHLLNPQGTLIYSQNALKKALEAMYPTLQFQSTKREDIFTITFYFGLPMKKYKKKEIYVFVNVAGKRDLSMYVVPYINLQDLRDTLLSISPKLTLTEDLRERKHTPVEVKLKGRELRHLREILQHYPHSTKTSS